MLAQTNIALGQCSTPDQHRPRRSRSAASCERSTTIYYNSTKTCPRSYDIYSTSKLINHDHHSSTRSVSYHRLKSKVDPSNASLLLRQQEKPSLKQFKFGFVYAGIGVWRHNTDSHNRCTSYLAPEFEWALGNRTSLRSRPVLGNFAVSTNQTQ